MEFKPRPPYILEPEDEKNWLSVEAQENWEKTSLRIKKLLKEKQQSKSEPSTSTRKQHEK